MSDESAAFDGALEAYVRIMERQIADLQAELSAARSAMGGSMGPWAKVIRERGGLAAVVDALERAEAERDEWRDAFEACAETAGAVDADGKALGADAAVDAILGAVSKAYGLEDELEAAHARKAELASALREAREALDAIGMADCWNSSETARYARAKIDRALDGSSDEVKPTCPGCARRLKGYSASVSAMEDRMMRLRAVLREAREVLSAFGAVTRVFGGETVAIKQDEFWRLIELSKDLIRALDGEGSTP